MVTRMSRILCAAFCFAAVVFVAAPSAQAADAATAVPARTTKTPDASFELHFVSSAPGIVFDARVSLFKKLGAGDFIGATGYAIQPGNPVPEGKVTVRAGKNGGSPVMTITKVYPFDLSITLASALPTDNSIVSEAWMAKSHFLHVPAPPGGTVQIANSTTNTPIPLSATLTFTEGDDAGTVIAPTSPGATNLTLSENVFHVITSGSLRIVFAPGAPPIVLSVGGLVTPGGGGGSDTLQLTIIAPGPKGIAVTVSVSATGSLATGTLSGTVEETIVQGPNIAPSYGTFTSVAGS